MTIDDFKDKLEDFFLCDILGFFDSLFYIIQIPFRGLKWWHKLHEPLCNDPVFKEQFEKIFDDIKCGRYESAERNLDLTNHYVKSWKP